MKRALFIASWDIGHVRDLLTNLGGKIGDNILIDAFDTSRNNEYSEIEYIHSSYHVEYGRIARTLLPVRKLGVFVHYYLVFKQLNYILKHNTYNYAAIVSVPSYTWIYVKLLHRYRVKVHLVPIGSDVLRSTRITRFFLRKSFKQADLVNCSRGNAVGEMVVNYYRVPQNKLILCGLGSNIITALNHQKKNVFTKEYMAKQLGIPLGTYVIACGYAGNKEQQHKAMLKAIAENRELLPHGYQVIVQLTYGSDKEILYSELSALAKELDLNVVFLRSFLTIETMVILRNYVDLFIHVQTTDGYNFSLQEYLLAGAQCINGSWLQYPKLEQTIAPYHKCERIHDLPDLIGGILTGKIPLMMLPDDTKKEIIRRDWDVVVESWKRAIDKV
ncbi:MAG: hypothetical protein J5382_03905 [Bacteroidales bacterium]|nr:hypothetical protein [Bacteroidales bacterium]